MKELGVWGDVAAKAKECNGSISHHVRESNKNRAFGAYSFSINGPAGRRLYDYLIEKLLASIADLGEVAMPHFDDVSLSRGGDSAEFRCSAEEMASIRSLLPPFHVNGQGQQQQQRQEQLQQQQRRRQQQQRQLCIYWNGGT
jgi:hypothetical protein